MSVSVTVINIYYVSILYILKLLHYYKFQADLKTHMLEL